MNENTTQKQEKVNCYNHWVPSHAELSRVFACSSPLVHLGQDGIGKYEDMLVMEFTGHTHGQGIWTEYASVLGLWEG